MSTDIEQEVLNLLTEDYLLDDDTAKKLISKHPEIIEDAERFSADWAASELADKDEEDAIEEIEAAEHKKFLEWTERQNQHNLKIKEILGCQHNIIVKDCVGVNNAIIVNGFDLGGGIVGRARYWIEIIEEGRGKGNYIACKQTSTKPWSKLYNKLWKLDIKKAVEMECKCWSDVTRSEPFGLVVMYMTEFDSVHPNAWIRRDTIDAQAGPLTFHKFKLRWKVPVEIDERGTQLSESDVERLEVLEKVSRRLVSSSWTRYDKGELIPLE